MNGFQVRPDIRRKFRMDHGFKASEIRTVNGIQGIRLTHSSGPFIDRNNDGTLLVAHRINSGMQTRAYKVDIRAEHSFIFFQRRRNDVNAFGLR